EGSSRNRFRPRRRGPGWYPRVVRIGARLSSTTSRASGSRRASSLPLWIAVTLIALPATAGATWIAGGNPVSTAAGDDVTLVAVPDGSGGIYLAWENRSPLSAVLASHVLADGSVAAGWPFNGMFLESGGAPVAADDGIGGLFLFWAHGIDFIPHMQSLNG